LDLPQSLHVVNAGNLADSVHDFLRCFRIESVTDEHRRPSEA